MIKSSTILSFVNEQTKLSTSLKLPTELKVKLLYIILPLQHPITLHAENYHLTIIAYRSIEIKVISFRSVSKQ